jgi:hypothetical protein
MHVSNPEMLLGARTQFSSATPAQQPPMSDSAGSWLGGLIVLGLVLVGFALPFM